MTLPKIKRNTQIIQLRISDPKKWSWRRLAKRFRIDHSTIQKLYKREIAKTTNAKI